MTEGRLQRILPAARWELRFKASRRANPPHEGHQRHVPLGGRGPLLLVGKRTAGARVASSPDSDLEAFSHNPTHGSFAPLAFQPSAMTNCANQRFLSLNYYCDTVITHVPYWWVNNPTLGEFCFTMIGRADIEGSKSNVAMNAWLPQASYPCGNFSDTSSFKFRRTKGSIGHAFTVRIRTGNQNQTSFYPFVPHEISVLVELILGHLRYLLTDVPPQPNSPPDNVFRPDRPAEADLGSKKRGSAPLPIHGISKITSSSPPTADGFGTGTPVPSPQSQSFSRGYGSILPTSLAYIVPSTRGCSPWRPDAVMSTTGRGRHSVLRIFKGRRGRTGHHATSHLNICYYHQDLHRRPLRPGSRPGFCSDRRALLHIGAWSLPRRPEFPLASPRSGIVHHLSGPDRYALTRTLHRRSGSVGGATHRGIPPISFLAPYGFTRPLTRTHVRLLGPCFKTGRMGSPQADARSAQHINSPGLGHHRNPRRSMSRVDRRTGSHRSTSDRDTSPAPIRFPPDNFKHSLTLFSKSFSSFPRGTCSLSVSRQYLALDGIYRPIGAAFPNNPTRRQRLVVRQGPGTTGLSPSLAPPSRGLGPGPPLRTLLQTTIRTPRATDFHGGLFPVRSPLLRESLLDGSRDSAIHTKYRISLRSSSMQEPRYPLPRVIVQWTSHNVAGSEPLTSPQSEHFTGPFNRQIAPPTKNGHAPPPIESRKSSQSVNPYYVWTCFPVLSQIKPQAPLLLFVFHKSKNFTSDYEIRMPPTVPVNHYSDPEGQHNRIRILWCYPMLMYTERQERIAGRRDEPTGAHRRRTDRPNPRSNYELFNCNNLNIRYWSWNYRGCWHQTCPPMDPPVSQAPSPESNPNSPSPVTTMGRNLNDASPAQRPCDPTSYHESSKQQAEPVLTFYLINASLPEVGVCCTY
uniref:Senescence-associated protein n=1 Tax=Glycine max TaxID=3847 RepID=A0A0R0GH95_SOYBN